MSLSRALERGRARIRLPRQPVPVTAPTPTPAPTPATPSSDDEGSISALSAASRRRIACLVGIGYLLMMVGWAFTTPLPAMDERAQVVKAAATVRGQLLGTIVHIDRADLGLPVNSDFGPGLASRFVVPRSYAGVPIPCFPAKPTYPRCAAPMTNDPTPTTALSYVGNYNPIYYALVGWPSLLTLGAKSVYLMRLCTALLNAALLALAAHTVLLARRPRRALICFLAATTPMTLFLGGIVNPSGVEVTSAELLWSVLLVLATDERPLHERMRQLGPRGAVALLLLLNLRMMGPLWAAGAIATAAWVATPARRREFLKDRWIRRITPVFLLAGVAALLWTKLAPVELSSLRDIHPHFFRAARVTFDETPGYFKMMLFSYNWGDPQIPTFAIVALSAVLAVLLVPVLGDRRFGRPLVTLIVVTVAFPILVQGYEMHGVGDVWQGRYILPTHRRRTAPGRFRRCPTRRRHLTPAARPHRGRRADLPVVGGAPQRERARSRRPPAAPSRALVPACDVARRADPVRARPRPGHSGRCGASRVATPPRPANRPSPAASANPAASAIPPRR